MIGYKETDSGIYGFNGKYRPFSNFDITPFSMSVDGSVKIFQSGEHAFHYFKTSDPTWRDAIINAETPSAAKRLGRECPLRSDWEQCKYNVMYDIVLNKFAQNDDLQNLLLSTEGKYLEETNTWNDTYWGVCNGVGKNSLGKILMSVREYLKRYEIERGNA